MGEAGMPRAIHKTEGKTGTAGSSEKRQGAGAGSDRGAGAVETRMGKKTIVLHHISKSYGEKKILEDFSYIVLKNQRLGLSGPMDAENLL